MQDKQPREHFGLCEGRCPRKSPLISLSFARIRPCLRSAFADLAPITHRRRKSQHNHCNIVKHGNFPSAEHRRITRKSLTKHCFKKKKPASAGFPNRDGIFRLFVRCRRYLLRSSHHVPSRCRRPFLQSQAFRQSAASSQQYCEFQYHSARQAGSECP